MEADLLIQQRIAHLIEEGVVIDREHEALCNRARYLRRLAYKVGLIALCATPVAFAAHLIWW